MNEITVFYDYVCPYCLLAKVPFEKAIEGKEVNITYIPYVLIEEPGERIDIVHDPVRRKAWEDTILPMSEKFGIGMRLPQVIPRPYTRMAIEGAYFAREYGKEREYHSRLFKAYFVEEQDIGELEVLVKLAAEVGLDAVRYKEAIENRTYGYQRYEDVRYAKDGVQIKSIPTYIVNGTKVENVYEVSSYQALLQ